MGNITPLHGFALHVFIDLFGSRAIFRVRKHGEYDDETSTRCKKEIQTDQHDTCIYQKYEEYRCIIQNSS